MLTASCDPEATSDLFPYLSVSCFLLAVPRGWTQRIRVLVWSKRWYFTWLKKRKQTKTSVGSIQWEMNAWYSLAQETTSQVSQAWRTCPSLESFCSFLHCLFTLNPRKHPAKGTAQQTSPPSPQLGLQMLPILLALTDSCCQHECDFTVALPCSQHELGRHPDFSLSGCSAKKRNFKKSQSEAVLHINRTLQAMENFCYQ